MTCGNFRRYANKTNIISGHGRFLLSEEEAMAIFDQIAETVRTRWRAEMRRTGVSGKDCEAISRAFLYDGLFYDLAA
jgi:serine/threonine-protein kinase HipA